LGGFTVTTAAVFPLVEPDSMPLPKTAPSLESLPNDAGRVARFITAMGENLRFVHEWETWYLWDGNRWRRDRDGGIMRDVKKFCLAEFERALREHADNPKAASEARREAAELGDSAQAARMLKMAESDPRVIVHPEKLDADPWLLGTGNGVVDLRTGTFRAGERQDYVTKATGIAYEASATCPRFELFLQEIFEGDSELVNFVAGALGYSLTGSVSEQVFFFLHGCGANGKSRLVETMLALMGEYGATTAPEIVALTRNDTPMHHLADLHGARFTTLPETEESHRLAESRIKSLTGGDEITACRKYEHPFRFKPQLKLWIHGNHKPEIRGTDTGIWRRVRLVPFNATFPPERRDLTLPENLATELPGILNYLIAACLRWKANGLPCPAQVKAATESYRTEQDVLAEFLDEKTMIVQGERVTRSALYASYQAWAEGQGIQKPWTQRAIAKSLRERGIAEDKDKSTRYWLNLRLKP
jgi:putative DNA primase/helicase